MPMPSWKPERENALRKMWDEGLTCAEIAERLETTVSAICAKSYRLELEERRPGRRMAA